jgi:subtilase family serine protease
VEDSNLYDNNDWTNFRAIFGLSQHQSGSLKVVHPAPIGGKACDNPGDNSDDDEATIDAEWASAAAPDATILVATCKASGTTDGVHLAIENLVNSENPPPIISISSMPRRLSRQQRCPKARRRSYRRDQLLAQIRQFGLGSANNKSRLLPPSWKPASGSRL